MVYPTQPSPAPYQDGTRIVFLGDSITAFEWFDNGVPDALLPQLNATISPGSIVAINSGVAGNKIADIQADIAGRVIAHNPDIVVIEAGTNDVGNTELPDYQASWLSVLAQIRAWKPDIPIVVLSIFLIFEQWQTFNGTPRLHNFNDEGGGATKTIEAYNDAARGTLGSISPHAAWVDLRAPALAYEVANNTPEPGAPSGILTSDGVHHLNTARSLYGAAARSFFIP